MAVEIITSFDQLCDASGNPLSGGKVYVYNVGTTTLRDIFSDTGLATPAANPIVTDSAGRADMRYTATGSYKIVVKTSADVTLYTRDNIDGRVPVGSGALAIANGGTGATSAGAALTALGGATAAELADVSAEVAALSGALASSEKTHIATGSTAQRPASPVEGDIRRNTTTTRWEGYVAAWQNFVTDNEIASQAEAIAGTDNTKVMTPLRAKQGNPFQSAFAHYREQQTSGTDSSDALTASAFSTRTLNTEVTDEIGITLGSNQMTIPAGTYQCYARAPANGGNAVTQTGKLRVRNVTAGTTLVLGGSVGTHGALTNASSGVVMPSELVVQGRFTLGSSSLVELQHWTGHANTNGGIAVTSGESEVYSEVLLWKVA